MPPTRVSSRSPGVTLTTSQAERLFNFDIGFAADHFELFSLLFFCSFSLVPVSLSLSDSYRVDLHQYCCNQEY